MLRAITLLLGFQLAGDVVTRALALPVPGPVAGMALLLAWLAVARRADADLDTVATTLVRHLSLLFVPAAVGVIRHLDRLGAEWPAIVPAIVVSTVLAIATGALAFVAVARLTGAAPGAGESREG